VGEPAWVTVRGAAADLADRACCGLGPSVLDPAADEAVVGLSAAERDAVTAAGAASLRDESGVPLALVSPASVAPARDGADALAGPLSVLHRPTAVPFPGLRRTTAEVTAALAGRACVGVATGVPLLAEQLAALAAPGVPVVVLALVAAAGPTPYPTAVGLVRSLRAGLASLPGGSMVVPVALPADATPAARSAALAAYGVRAVDVPVVDPATLEQALAQEAPPAWLAPPSVAAALATVRPPLRRRGVVLLLSGLSGSGKSTLAQALAEALVERTTRTVSLLDGDEVRHLLSAGLGFSREDRELNVARIGFVAAEAARHGGVAICAPIAPYASARSRVREQAAAAGAQFALVHVATPLAVCEARDRKGLYAAARAGRLAGFTGVSDPYEEPTDADLVLDTTDTPIEAGVAALLDLLRTRGLVGEEPGEPG